MRLLGNYAFEALRKAMQGVFECYQSNGLYIIELWNLRAVISPHEYVELFVNGGSNQGYISLGKIILQ